jgi:hypothetical protein
LAVGDVDRDGDLDIAYTGLTNNIVGWYENNGSQVFTMTNIDAAAMAARNVVLVDLDKDGDMDLVAASTNDDTVAWYENNGSQAFTKHVITSTSQSAWNLSTGDYDGDGDVDVVVASQADKRVTVYVNNGSQAFSPQTVTSAFTSPKAAILADVDHDGRLDVVMAASVSNTVAWFKQLAPGDYNNTGNVDGADFLLWQRTLGNTVAAGSGADGNHDGAVNAADLTLWIAGMGAPASSASTASLSSAALNLSESAFLTSDMFSAADKPDAALLEPQNVLTVDLKGQAHDVAIAEIADNFSELTQFTESADSTSDGNEVAAALADELLTAIAS